jgi:hypothetical protein
MPKITKDWIGMTLAIGNLVALTGTAITRAVPVAWIEGKHAWPIMFCVFAILLALWYINAYLEHQMFGPIRDLATAISNLEKAVKELSVTVGNQHNRVEALIGQVKGNHEYTYSLLTELLKRTPAAGPKT